jgi:hypothetical protein
MSFITLTEAQDMIALYQDTRSGLLASGYSTDVLPLSITFSKEDVDNLLSQQGTDKLRIYFGMQDTDNLIDVILVAVDANDDDIVPSTNYRLLDRGARCPSNCPPASVLNS